MTRVRRRIPKFDAKLKRDAKRALTRAADWLVRNQVTDAWPFWDANRGRFPYHVLIDPKKRAKRPRMWSTCWKTSRAVQGILSAYAVTGKKAYLDAAERGLDYVATLQVFDPGIEPFHGAFREDSPQGTHLAYRDGMEAVQAFINAYLLTKNDRWLRHATAGTDYVLRIWQSDLFPPDYIRPLTGGAKLKIAPGMAWCFWAAPLIFAQLAAITGQRKYVTRGAAPMMDAAINRYILPSGALGLRDEDATETHHLGHTGPLKNVLSNDDGVGEAMLCTWAMTGKKKYLDAALGMADFWVEVDVIPERLAAFASIALFLADVYRLTRDRKYLPAIDRFTRMTLDLQCLDRGDPEIYGGFIGEDMAKTYDRRTVPTDWVDLRITSYAMIALGKIAADRSKEWGGAYSCFGW